MQWENGRLSDNVEDAGEDQQQQPSLADVSARAGMAAAGIMMLNRGKTPWVAIIAIVLIFFALIGFNSFRAAENRTMQKTAGLQAEQQAALPAANGAQGSRMRFISAVLAETEDVWGGIYRAEGKTYQEPGLILYRTAIRSACGAATTSIGPFYCPNDRKIYLDESFFDQLAQRFGAPGEFASAYVIAHEVGHHIQNLDGTLATIDAERDKADQKTANILTERLELQADCYAGIWANHMKSRGVADGRDIDLALNAAHKIGDDNLQRAAQGYVVPDSFTHGSSAQRAYWFTEGLTTGDPKACNTITGKI